tara:strand:- start:886 stop:1770 length:885 start_codon:yes stop_codon:yes gene_type:complete
MLSLKSSNNSSATKFRKAKPNRLGGKLIGWWDFTDASTLFQTVGGTAATATDDPIGQVLNKAYNTKWGRAGDNGLGQYLYALTTARPLLKYDVNKIIYADFDGSNDEMTATSDLSKGGVGGDKLTDSSITYAAFTIFAVFNPHDATVSADQYIFRIVSDNSGDICLRIDNDTTDTIQGTNANGGTRVNKTVASGVTNATGVQLWTWVSNCDNNGNTSDLYKNGDTSTGAGDQPGNSGSVDLTGTSNNNRVSIGGSGTSTSEYDGAVYEILFYNALLSDNEIKTINRYLTTKYGL